MIDNSKQYAEYCDRDLRAEWDRTSWQWLWDNDICPTLESLRAVARAAQAVRAWTKHYDIPYPVKFNMHTALDALPEWVLEEE